LEEDGDYIDRDENRSAACRRHGEEDKDYTRFEEFDREDATRCGSEDGVYLLDSEYNKENIRVDEAERHGHDSRDESTEGENGSSVVYLTCAVFEGDPRARVLVREHEEVDRCTDGIDTRNGVSIA
jgi:hypothetical protein